MITSIELKCLEYIYLNKTGYSRKIARDLNLPPITISRCLRKLKLEKIMYLRKEGNLKNYSLNYNNFETIGLIEYIENKRLKGINRLLITSLVENLKDKEIDFCILYGSIVRKALTKNSDIDILFVSKSKKITEICRELSVLTNRDISPHILSNKKFNELIRKKESFVLNTILNPKNRIFIIGIDKFLKSFSDLF